MRAYADPTADIAISHVMREWKENRKKSSRQGRAERLSLDSFRRDGRQRRHIGLGFGSGGGVREIGRGQRHETDFLHE
ncbi:MAG: hypothetical protein IJ058_11300 [Lachnospiraceae bacterium]|nr:hypothetical protein [Lachnospiraceae bacterium]